MKTLANCNPLEFLTQTNKIRKSAANWLTLTKVLEIRRTVPDIPAEATGEEKTKAFEAQVQKNLSAMLDAILDEHPKETAELLCHVCFIDPKEMDQHSMAEILTEINALLANKEVVDFFVSLARLGLTNGSARVKE